MSALPHKPLRRPEADASTPEIHRYRRSIAVALAELGVDYGEEFVIVAAKDFQQQKSLDDLDGQLGPFAKDSETSRQAALDTYPRQGSQRHRILITFAAQIVSRDGTRHGYTRDDLEEIMRPPLTGNTIRPRVQELMEGGFLEETDRTRRTRSGSDATVLAITEHGQREAEKNR